MQRDTEIEHSEPLPAVEDYPALREARARLQFFLTEVDSLEAVMKEHARTADALRVELSGIEDGFVLGHIDASPVSTVRQSLATAEAERLQAQAALDAHHLNIRRLRGIVSSIEVQAQRDVLALLRPLHAQAVRRMAVAFEALREAAQAEQTIREKGRIRTDVGWSSPIAFCNIVSYDGFLGRVKSTLPEMHDQWCGDPNVKQILADGPGQRVETPPV